MSDIAAEMLYLYLLGLAVILILVVGTWKASTAGGTKKRRTPHRDRRIDVASASSAQRRDPQARVGTERPDGAQPPDGARPPDG
jgi:hypothetical protein